jgi:hypothetical protein
MGTIIKTVLKCMERFWQKQFKLNYLTLPGWENAADDFPHHDKMYSTSGMRVPAVVWQQLNDNVPAPPLNRFRELMDNLDIVPGISHKPQVTSRPGSSHIRLGSVKPQSKSSIPSHEIAAEPDSSTLLTANPVEPASSYPSI